MTVAAFIMAGGRGSRVKGPLSKIELPIAGLPCYKVLLKTLSQVKGIQPYLIGSPDLQKKEDCFTVQQNPQGTGHAVMVACDAWKGPLPERVLILCADVPLIKEKTLKELLKQGTKNAITLLSFQDTLPNTYGRLVLQKDGSVDQVCDARDEKRSIQGTMLAYSGIMLVQGKFLWESIKELSTANNQKEYYITDLVKIARKKGELVLHTPILKEEAQGLNTWADWVQIEKVYQARLRESLFNKGALVREYVRLNHDTILEPGVVVENFVTFGEKVVVQKNTRILPQTHLENCTVGQNCVVGPFAHIHSESVFGKDNKIGNFVEVKKTTTGDNVRSKHMTYLGNATIGNNVNIGGGVITANFTGLTKEETFVEDNVFIGANSTLIAPVTLKEDSFVGAGTTIKRDVEKGSLAIGRVPQKNVNNWKQKGKK